MPRLSIIIPLHRCADLVESTLVSVLENRPANCEIIVVLSEDYDDPYQLSGEVRFISARKGAGFVECLNVGIEASQAPIVHLLASGVEVADGWADAAIDHFTDRRVAAVSPVAFDLIDHRRIVAAGVQYWSGGARSVCKGVSLTATNVLGPLGAAAFYRKSALALAGGLQSETGDLLADVDLALRLKETGFSCVLEPACKVQFRGEPVAEGNALQRGRHAERLFWRNLSPEQRTRSVLLHGLVVIAEVIRNCYRPSIVAQMIGRSIAACEFGSYARHQAKRRVWKEAAKAASSASQMAGLRVDSPHAMTRSTPAVEARVRQ